MLCLVCIKPHIGRGGSHLLMYFAASSTASHLSGFHAMCVLQVSQVVGRGFASLFNSYCGLPSSLEVNNQSYYLIIRAP